MRNVAWKSPALGSQNLTLNFSSLRYERCCQNVHTTQCKIDIAIISEDENIIQTSMKHFLLLLLRNAMKHYATKFSTAWLHNSSDKFWNYLKDFKCNNVKNYCLLANKRTLRSSKSKKNICKTFYRLKMQRIQKEILDVNSSFTIRNACRVSDTGTSPCISFFFNHPTSIKRFVSATVGKRWLKPLCGKMLDWLNFRLGEIIGLIHALKKRCYQNKTLLRYNFGSV